MSTIVWLSYYLQSPHWGAYDPWFINIDQKNPKASTYSIFSLGLNNFSLDMPWKSKRPIVLCQMWRENAYMEASREWIHLFMHNEIQSNKHEPLIHIYIQLITQITYCREKRTLYYIHWLQNAYRYREP